MKYQQASDNRDSLCKEMYSQLFKWIVARINKSMNITGVTKSKIGVLDIFGFEIFEKNSFEQMCINFANEKLQQHFTSYTFKMENALYESEGIDFKGVPYIDNQNVLDLLEKKRTGLFSMLNEELRVPRGSSNGFYNKAIKKHENNTLFKSRTKDSCFTVSHYAGNVTYSSESLLEKNRDSLFEDLLKLLATSSRPLISSIYSSDKTSDSPGQKSKSSGKQSIASLFGAQLNTLMKTLYSTTPHYIRCIKPNTKKKPGIFSKALVMEQLKYSGIFEAVTIRKSGYPFRHSHELFWKRFKCLVSGIDNKSEGNNYAALSKLLLQALLGDIPEVKDCILGKTLVLYRAEQNKILESSRGIVRLNAAITCQHSIKVGVAKLQVSRWLVAANKLKNAIKVESIDALKAAVAFCMDAVSGSNALDRTILGHLLHTASKLIQRLEEISRIKGVLKDLFARPPLQIYADLKNILRDAEKIHYDDDDIKKGVELLQTVSMALETRSNMALAAEEFDYDMINEGIPKLIELQSIYGEDFGKAEIAKAKKSLSEIENEWKQHIPKLQRAIEKGAVIVPDETTKAEAWTKYALASVSVAHLQYAGDEGKMASIKSKRGKELLLGIQVLQVVRSLLLDDKWDMAVEHLKALNNVKDKNLLQEINAIRSAYAINSQIPVLLGALKSGQAGTIVPSTIESIQTDTLAKSVAMFEACEFTAPDIVSLVKSSDIVLRVRKLWKDRMWVDIEAVLKENNIEKLHDNVQSELKLAATNCMYHRLMSTGTNAIESENVRGKVGTLDLSLLKLDHLETTIKDIKDLRCNDVASKKMLQTLQFLFSVRNDIQSTMLESVVKRINSFDVSDLLISCHDEVDLCKRHAEDILLQDRMKACLSTGNVDGEPGNIKKGEIIVNDLSDCILSCKSSDISTSYTKRLIICGKEILQLRQKILSEDWDALFEVVKALSPAFGIFDRSQKEAEKVQHEVMERLALDKLRYALNNGKIKKKDEFDLDYNCISIADISIAYEFVKKWNCSGTKVRRYLNVAKATETIRMNLKARNWIKLKIDVSSVSPNVAMLMEDEIELAKTEVENVEFVENASNALKGGGPVGNIGTVAIELLDTVKLDKCIRVAASFSRLRSDSKALLETSELVLKNRLSLATGAFEDIVSVQDQDITAFHSIAHPELKRMRQEKENHMLTKALIAAMEIGKVTGIPGKIKKDSISCKAISDAVKLSEKYGVLSVEANGLMEDCEKLSKLRNECKDDKWDALSVSIINLQSRMFYSRQNRQKEFDLILKHFYNHSLVSKAIEALSLGAPTGILGSLDSDTLDVELLNNVIQYELKHGCHSDTAQKIMQIVKHVKGLRDSVKRHIWTGVLQKQIKSLTSLLKSFSDDTLPKELNDEIARVQDELNHKRVIERLRSGLKHGRISGKIGNLNKSSIKYEDLNEAIEYANKIGCKSTLTEDLKKHAISISQIRQSLLACLWSVADKSDMPELWQSLNDDVNKAVKPDDDEVVKAFGELNNYRNMKEMNATLRDNAVTGTLESFDLTDAGYEALDATIHRVEQRGILTADANFFYGLCKQFSSLRGAVLSSNWKQVKDISAMIKKKIVGPDDKLLSKISKSCLHEVQLCYSFSEDRLLVASMTDALRDKAVFGVGSNLSLSKGKLETLQRVIKHVEAIECRTVESIDLLKKVKSFYELREAIKNGDWSKISKCLKAESFKLIMEGDIGHEEFVAVKNAEEEHSVVKKLRAAIAEGAPEKLKNPKQSFLDYSTIRTEELETAIAFASEVGCKSTESQTLNKLADYTLRIRQHLECANIKKAGGVCEDAFATDITNDEIEIVQTEYQNTCAIKSILGALEKGQVEGDLGNLNLPGIKFHALQMCTNEASAITPKTEELDILISSCNLVCKLRELVHKSNWSEVTNIFMEVEADFTNISECCHPEMNKIRSAMEDHNTLRSLQNALSIGPITGVVGSLNLRDVNISVLSKEINLAEELVEVSIKTRNCLSTAKSLLTLRKLVTKDMWEACASLIKETDISQLSQTEAVREFNLISYHLKFKNAVQSMEKSLINGCVFIAGQQGVEISNDSDIKDISHALALAKGLANTSNVNISNAKFAALLATVEIVCNMRSAGLLSKWEQVKLEVDKCIKLVETKKFYKTAADEVNRAEDYYFGWKILTNLTLATSTGSIRLDVNGNCVREGIEYIHLEAALDELQDMQTSSDRANDLLKGSLGLYQVRNAIKNNDLDNLETAISEMKDVEDPSLKNEFVSAKKILEDHKINLELNAALDNKHHVYDSTRFELVLRKVKSLYGSGTSVETIQFMAFCEYVVSLQQKLLNERWEELAEILSNPPELDSTVRMHEAVNLEVQRIHIINLNHIIQANIRQALEEGDISGDVDQLDISSMEYTKLEKCISHSVKHITALDGKSKSLLKSARYVYLVRETAGTCTNNFESLIDVISKEKVDAVDVEAKDELALVYHYVQNLIARRALRSELRQGCIGGTYEELNLEKVNLKGLRQVIEKVSHGFQVAEETSMLLNLATYVELIRQNILNMDKLDLLLRQIPENIEYAAEELTLVKRFFFNEKLKVILEDIFRDNLPTSKEMLEAIDFSKQCELIDANNKILLNSTKCLLALRQASNTTGEEWVSKITAVLHESEGYGKDLIRGVIDELNKARIRLEDEQAAQILRTAIASGGPDVAVLGELDPASVSVQQLDAAIKDVSLFTERSDHTDILLRSARILRLTRMALMKNDYAVVENFDKVCIEAQDEFSLIVDELWNKQLQHHLNEVLSRGKVIGFVGNLRTEVVQTEPLAIVLADADNEDHAKSQETTKLIECARLVLSLRRGISGKIINSHEMHRQITTYTGKIFEVATDEINLIKDEVALRMALSILEAALEHQSLKELNEAIIAAEDLPTMNAQGRQLVRFAKLMKKLLDAEEVEDWDGIKAVINVVDEADEHMPTNVVMKFHNARVRVDNRNAEVLLREAITNDRVTGSVEEIDLEAISTEKLDRSLLMVKNVEELNKDVEDLARVALAIRECRRCVLSDRISLLTNNTLMIGKVESIDIAKQEVELVRQCVDNKKVVNILSSALMSDETSGTIVLDEAIEVAQRLSCKSKRAKELLKTAYIVVRIRQLRQNGNWEALLDYTKDLDPNFTGISEQEIKKAVSDSLHFARTVLVAREAMEKKDWPTVRSALALYDSFPSLDDGRIDEEIDAIRGEVNDRSVCEAFRHALSQGGAQGHAGRIVVTSIRLSLLDKSISLANELGCNSSEAQSFYRTAYVIQQLRTAAKAGEWLAVEAVLQHALPGGVREIEAGSSMLDKIVHDELRLLLDHIVDLKMTRQLNDAIKSGRIVTDIETGEVDLQAVDPKPLASALKFVEEHGCRSEYAERLSRTVQRLHTLRTALISRDWVGVFKVVKESANEEMTRLEMTSALNAVANMRSEESLRRAIQEDAVDGVVGHIICDRVKLETLDDAIKSAREAGIASKQVEILLSTAQIVRRLRYAVLENDWEEVEQTISTAAMLAASGKFAAEAEAEMNLCLEEVEDRKLQNLLQNAMGSSGSKMLKDAIAVSRSTILIHSERTEEMLNKATFLADIRQAYEVGDMVRVQAMSSSVPIASLKDSEREEVTMLLNNASDTLVMKSLWDAIQSPGQALVVDGKLDVTTISRSRLLLAISDAKQEKIASEDVLQAVEIAQSLANLRGYLSTPSWNDAYLEILRLEKLCKAWKKETPKLLRVELSNARAAAFKFVTNERYGKKLHSVVKVQSVVRRFLHKKYANNRLQATINIQKIVRTYEAKKLRSKLLDQRNEAFLAAREKEKEIIKRRNIQQWDLAANSIVKDIHKGIRMARSPEDSTDDAIQILSRSLKIGRSIRLHQHYDARVVAQIVRCEKVLRQLLYERIDN